jgi:TonB family protein
MDIDNPLIWGETPLQTHNSVGYRSDMAHHSMFDPVPAKTTPSVGDGGIEKGTIPSVEDAGRQELAELAAKFTVHGGGRVSPEVSADLALEIVLNEIAEQACLATPANGAAIVLKRDGEWVCRASAGDNSPSLGGRLDAGAGLSGACIKTRQVQRCDDAQSDPRADVEACRALGVRGVVILPLLLNDEVAGVFEAFSPHPAAFGGRDEHTLEVLSQRVLALLKQTSEPTATFAKPAEGTEPAVKNSVVDKSIAEDPDEKGEARYRSYEADSEQESKGGGNGRGINLLTWILGAGVLAGVLLLTVRVGQRLVGGKAAPRVHSPALVSTPSGKAEHDSKTAVTGASGTQSAAPRPSNLLSSGSASAAPAANVPHATYSPPPAGSLLVYEKGKEIFRMPPAAEQGERISPRGSNRTGPAADGTVVRPASGTGRAGIYEMSPQVAEGSLLHRVEPDYPAEARQQQIQGPVVLDVRIGRDGTIQETKLLSGPPLLADAAITAVKQWRFRPQGIKGQPIEMQTRITLNFRLPR